MQQTVAELFQAGCACSGRRFQMARVRLVETQTAANLVADAYDAGRLVPLASSQAERRKLRDAARATLVKDRRVNIRLSSPLLSDLQARAAEEGMPYQTLIASVLHKYVTGRLVEKPSRMTANSGSRG